MTDFDAPARGIAHQATRCFEVLPVKSGHTLRCNLSTDHIAAALHAAHKAGLEEAMRATCDGCRLAGFKLIDGRLHRPPCDGMRCRALHLRALMDRDAT